MPSLNITFMLLIFQLGSSSCCHYLRFYPLLLAVSSGWTVACCTSSSSYYFRLHCGRLYILPVVAISGCIVAGCILLLLLLWLLIWCCCKCCRDSEDTSDKEKFDLQTQQSPNWFEYYRHIYYNWWMFRKGTKKWSDITEFHEPRHVAIHETFSPADLQVNISVQMGPHMEPYIEM